MKKIMIVLMALTMCAAAIHAQEIEKVDKFTSGYINGTYMNKYKTIDGVLYAVGYVDAPAVPTTRAFRSSSIPTSPPEPSLWTNR